MRLGRQGGRRGWQGRRTPRRTHLLQGIAYSCNREGRLCPQLGTSPPKGPSGQFRAVRVQPPVPGNIPEPPAPPPAPGSTSPNPRPGRDRPPSSGQRWEEAGRERGREGRRERGWEAGQARGWAGLGCSRLPPSAPAPLLPAPPAWPWGRAAAPLRAPLTRSAARSPDSGVRSAPALAAPGRSAPPAAAASATAHSSSSRSSSPCSRRARFLLLPLPLSSPSPPPPSVRLSLATSLACRPRLPCLVSFPFQASTLPPPPAPPVTPPPCLFSALPPLFFLRAQSPPPSPPPGPA